MLAVISHTVLLYIVETTVLLRFSNEDMFIYIYFVKYKMCGAKHCCS